MPIDNIHDKFLNRNAKARIFSRKETLKELIQELPNFIPI